MKKNLKLIVSNLIMCGILSIAYFLPQYQFLVKTFFNIFLILGIISTIYILSALDKKDKFIEDVKEKRKSNLYMTIDVFFDIVFIIAFAFLDYRFMFVLWLMNMLFSYVIYSEIMKKDK